MKQFFTFRFLEPSESVHKSLVIFTELKINFEYLSSVLKEEVQHKFVPKNVFLVSCCEEGYSLSECTQSSSFKQEFDNYIVGNIEEKLRCINVSNKGDFEYCDGSSVERTLRESILKSGMLEIFRERRGLIVSNDAYHFVKPSGAHCNAFIRASNLLVSSCEVSFLALSILPHLNEGIKRVYVDTSSIAFLICSALRLSGHFSKNFPSIESFESYGVFNQSYSFTNDADSIVFISATTSGSLVANLLNNTVFSNNQVVTLFYTSISDGQVGIFDVKEAVNIKIESTKAESCVFCQRGSKLIRIAGEQFLPENPKHELLVIRKTDFSKKYSAFLNQFSAKGVLKFEQLTRNNDSEKEHFFIDVKKALQIDNSQLLKRLEKEAKRHISHDLNLVITFDDEGSQVLKDKLKKYIDSKRVQFKNFSEIKELNFNEFGSVLVIAGAITSGRTLLRVSRGLRNIKSTSSIVYFVGFSKLPNNEIEQQLKKDLCQGGHDFVILDSCYLPRIKKYGNSNNNTAWQLEENVLKSYSSSNFTSELGNQLPKSLEERYLSLIDGELDANKLFLPDSNNNLLKVRPTFAFWSDWGLTRDQFENATQADVYWTIQCVMHELRNRTEGNGLFTTYHTTLLSPVNFDRYNDGVIQACLLRAALPVELNYRLDSVFSRQMTDVILSVLNNWNSEQGEACLEFLFALWSGRLMLLEDHTNEIIKCHTDNMSDEIKFMLKQIKN